MISIGDKFITKVHFSSNIQEDDIVTIIDIYDNDNNKNVDFQIVELYNETKNKSVKIYKLCINKYFKPINSNILSLINLLELLLNRLL